MKITAQRVVSAPQFEFLLRVKQAGNGQFSFLEPGNSLHAYYLFLKGQIAERDRTQNVKKSSSNGEKTGAKVDIKQVDKISSSNCLVDYVSSSEESLRGNSEIMPSMAGLLTCYDSSDDEDEVKKLPVSCEQKSGKGGEDKKEDSKNAITSTDDKEAESSECAAKSVNENIHVSSDQDRKAKRLKRAKLMKSHFTLKMKDV